MQPTHLTRWLAVALLSAGLGVFAARTAAAAQHETAADLLDGERAFKNTCANCHGPDGDVIPGIDLGRGRFRRPMSDDDLVRIIRTGIPNTPMPASQMTASRPEDRGLPAHRAAAMRGSVAAGDPLRGKAVFERQGACAYVPSRRPQRLARGPRPHRCRQPHRRRDRTGASRPGGRRGARQPHLPRRVERRHRGDRAAARSRHVLGAAPRLQGAAAVVPKATCASWASWRRRCRRIAPR